MSANLKRGCGILLIVFVVLLSILALLPDADVDHDAGYTSSELSIRENVDGSVTSTSYVNFDGVITEAIDMGYATVCRMQDDNGRVVEERYLDANGDPVARYGDYYGLSYEYDEMSTVIAYLDAEGNPIILSDGYSIIVRTQVGGRASDDFYYDLNGQQVQCSGGYYGLHRGYNSDGQNISLTFFDKDGHAVSTSSGYAIKTCQRDMDGTIVGEQYFDTEGKNQRGLCLVSMASYTNATSKDTSDRSPILVQMANPPLPMQAILSSNVPIIEMEQQIRICILMRMAIQRHCLKGSTASNAVAR